MSEWQPIETAPKDGSSILAWIPVRGEPLVLRWEEKMRDTTPAWRTTVHPFMPFRSTDGPAAPTHWMPLPEPVDPNPWRPA